MIKKNIIKRKKKTLGVLNIFLLIVVSTISLSIGYSYFSSRLNIIGGVTLKTDIIDPDAPLGGSSSTLEVKIGSSYNHENTYYYNLNFVLTNLDEHVVDGWTITIDMPPYVDIDKSQFWGTAEITVKKVGECDRLVLTNYDWNKEILVNGQINFGCNIAFNKDVELIIGNVTFNERLIQDVQYSTN